MEAAVIGHLPGFSGEPIDPAAGLNPTIKDPAEKGKIDYGIATHSPVKKD
jgi:hypothetical protein